MNAIVLPPELEAWARAEVEAGRAESVEALVARGLRALQDFAELRRSLDEAEAEAARDPSSVREADAVFDDLEKRLKT